MATPQLILPRRPWRTAHAISAALLGVLVASGAGCSGDDDAATQPVACTGGGGPVPGAADDHCTDTDGQPIVQDIGKCSADAGDLGGGGAAGAGGAAEPEPYEVRFSNSAADDDCKYDVSFKNSCIALNTQVFFTVTLDKRSGGAAPGATADSPEIYFADDPFHISPSNNIKAPEGPPGTYKIGPIVFDRSGRWVVRFHFFETCSDIPEDSPHGHVAFYVDVP